MLVLKHLLSLQAHTRTSVQAELVLRIAAGGCVDPGIVTVTARVGGENCRATNFFLSATSDLRVLLSHECISIYFQPTIEKTRLLDHESYCS